VPFAGEEDYRPTGQDPYDQGVYEPGMRSVSANSMHSAPSGGRRWNPEQNAYSPQHPTYSPQQSAYSPHTMNGPIEEGMIAPAWSGGVQAGTYPGQRGPPQGARAGGPPPGARSALGGDGGAYRPTEETLQAALAAAGAGQRPTSLDLSTGTPTGSHVPSNYGTQPRGRHPSTGTPLSPETDIDDYEPELDFGDETLSQEGDTSARATDIDAAAHKAATLERGANARATDIDAAHKAATLERERPSQQQGPRSPSSRGPGSRGPAGGHYATTSPRGVGTAGRGTAGGRRRQLHVDNVKPYMQVEDTIVQLVPTTGPDGRIRYIKRVVKTSTTLPAGGDGKYTTEKDGVVETRIERKMVISSDGDEQIDHDAALAEAIRSVTEMDPNLSVEKIEIKTESEAHDS